MFTKIRVPFFSHSITNDDKKSISRALDSNLLTDGPILRQFEQKFAEFTDATHAVGTSNATSALYLALRSVGIREGDEVIIPNITFVATANAVLQTGAKPILADVDYETMNISHSEIIKKINKKTRAIIPVHLAGKSCDMETILKIAKRFRLKIIEDCAHAIGTKYKNKHVGTFGDVGCFSFYPTKNITTIEGGMAITNSEKIAEYIRVARNHGINRNLMQRYSKRKPWEYDVKEVGYNFRLDEIRSALGLSQLKRIGRINKERRQIYEFYNMHLRKITGIALPSDSNTETNSHHLYIIKVTENCKITRDEMYEGLLKNGIQTTIHYKPLNHFTVLKKESSKSSFPNSEILYKQCLSLPFYPGISKRQLEYVIDVIRKIT